MHCKGEILFWDVYTLFLIWWDRVASTGGIHRPA
jgi:hypothetical protein